jgi:hypothetical protein
VDTLIICVPQAQESCSCEPTAHLSASAPQALS